MTAVTRAGTLSRVMISWGGTSIVTVLRSILTILSTTGRRMKSPGPFGPPSTLPSLKITPRSYSLTILMALNMTATTTIATITTTIAVIPTPTACNKPRVAYTRNPPLSWPVEIPGSTGQFDGHYLHYSSFANPTTLTLCPTPIIGSPSRGSVSSGAKASTARHSSPCTNTHPEEFTPTGLLTVPTSPIIPSLPVRAGLPVEERNEPKRPKSTPPMSIATTTMAPSSNPEYGTPAPRSARLPASSVTMPPR